jgi:hypothetical protein
VENEASSATTRQYARQQPANPYDTPYQSQLAQTHVAHDNRSGGQTPNTSRLYPDSMAPNTPNYSGAHQANHQQPVQKKSGALKWILITLICVTLVSGAISAMVISVIRAQRRAHQEIARDGRIESPPRPQDSAPPASVREPGLEKYKYPNSTLENSVNVFGSEVLEMTTSDSVKKVSDYYKKQLGAPMIEDDGRAVVFQVNGSPMTIITINQDEEDPDKTRITGARTNLKMR